MSQHMDALALANERRLAQFRCRKSIKAMSRTDGLRAVAELLRDPPVYVGSMRVLDVLGWPRQMGGQYATRVLRRSRARCSPVVRVMDLTERQRLVLADELDLMAAPADESRAA